jgi:signal recognition particle subunit SRP54
MLAVRKMGPIGNLLGMLPGGAQMKEAAANIDDKHLDRLQAIIRGMTPAERADPKIINASRRARIANGSGVRIAEVNDLVNRFFDARKMMQQMAGRFGFGGGGGGMSRKAKKNARKKIKGRGSLPALPGFPGGAPDLSKMPPGLNELPPGLSGLDQLPPGFDPSKLKFPKNK